ncbi:MAG TPA: HU family DNA-binding protein [Candidatus Paceibacterota bacterium]
MNKADIISKVHEVLGTTKAEAERAVDTVFDSIEKALKDGTQVSVAGFGIFEAKMRAKREARNPRTGETVTVAAMRVPKFRAAKALKDTVK